MAIYNQAALRQRMVKLGDQLDSTTRQFNQVARLNGLIAGGGH